MSHFTVLVIGPNPEEQLKPFDENLEVERYLLFSKEDVIERERSVLISFKEEVYNVYLKDPDAYLKKKRGEGHMRYLTEIFPRLHAMDDEELFQAVITGYDQKNIDEDGNVWATSNPDAKWDYYKLGGRWQGYFNLRSGKSADQALKKDIVFPFPPPFAIVKNGEWIERGTMGWFGVVTEPKEDADWNQEFQAAINGCDENTLFSLYDCHT